MKEGDCLRLRSVRDYGLDGRSWASFTCSDIDDDEKHVFVAMLLGVEPLNMKAHPELLEAYQERIRGALLRVGFMPIDEAVEAGADPKKLKFELVSNPGFNPRKRKRRPPVERERRKQRKGAT